MMTHKAVRGRILPLYLELYEDLSEGSYRQFDEHVVGVADVVRSAGVDVTVNEVVFSDDHVRKARSELAKGETDFIILLYLAYSPSLLIADMLEECGLPILFIDTTPAASFRNMTKSYLMQNHGIHGVMDLTSVLKSRGVRYSVVAGHPKDNVFSHRLAKTLRGMAAAVLLKGQTIGTTGMPFEGMGDFAVDPDALLRDFGHTLKEISLQDIVDAGKTVSGPEIDDVVKEDAEIQDISGIDPKHHREAIRVYLALRSLMDREHITGYTMNFQHITEGIATPFYACSKLISLGYGYGGEGDVLTATLGMPLNYLAGVAKFDEFFCADWERDRILMSHMGESDARFIKEGSSPYLTMREGFLNPRPSVIYRFQAQPGEVTFVNLCPAGNGRYRLVMGLLDIVDAPVLDRIVAPHYQVRTRMPVGAFLEEYAQAGGGHHLYVARGNILDELAIVSRILDFEYTQL